MIPYSLSDILVRTTKIAISDSDIHCFENGVKSGITLGHDAVGVVVDVSFLLLLLPKLILTNKKKINQVLVLLYNTIATKVYYLFLDGQ